jgi:molybdenum ABC transporter ATP-binding protein
MAGTIEKSVPALPSQPLALDTLEVRVRRKLQREENGFELDVSFAIGTGITILFGASGAGKTTLLDCIAGLLTPEAGCIALASRVLFDSEKKTNLPPQQRGIGYVFQDLALFPHLNAEENVAYGLSGLPPHERRNRIASMFDLLGILALAKRRPAELSGGERQRVALARALVLKPPILLLDEPLAGLDLPVRMKIADDLRRWIKNSPIPVLYVTHNREEVFALGEKMLVIEGGQIIAQGTPHQVMSAPRSETVAQLAGFENVFNVEVASIHEDRGTMTCRVLAVSNFQNSFERARLPAVPPNADKKWALACEGTKIELETPLVRADVGSRLRVGISAGDVLLATSAPVGLSARNVLPGRLLDLSQRDMIVVARVDCGVEMSVHLTLAARDSLELVPGRQVWLIVKTHSCHLLAG